MQTHLFNHEGFIIQNLPGVYCMILNITPTTSTHNMPREKKSRLPRWMLIADEHTDAECSTGNALIEAKWRIYASVNHAIISSDNGLSPVRRQAIIRTNGGILLIKHLRTHFSEHLVEIQAFSLNKIQFKSSCAISAISSRPQCVNFITTVFMPGCQQPWIIDNVGKLNPHGTAPSASREQHVRVLSQCR